MFNLLFAQVRIKVFRGHSGKVNRCQFINAASQVLSASVDCSVKIWQPVHGTQLCSMNNIHAINIADVHCLEDGSRLVVTILMYIICKCNRRSSGVHTKERGTLYAGGSR